MKKLLSLLLALIIILPVIPFSVFAFESNPFASFDAEREEKLKEAFGVGNSGNELFDVLNSYTYIYGTPAVSLSDFGERYIVKFKSDVSLDEIHSIISFTYYKLLAKSTERLFLVYLKDIESFENAYSEQIEYIEPDLVRSLSYVPSDPLYSSQWEYKDFGMETVWDVTLGDEDIIVAVLDSGIERTHEELSEAKILNGFDAIENQSGVNEDPLGHGTAVAGIIAASHNDNGVAGIAPNVTLLPVRVTSEEDKIFSSDFMEGLRFAADGGADIINMSFGGGEMSAAEQDAVNYAADMGCILVAASGNYGNSIKYAGDFTYPASYEHVISVASLNKNGEISGFSQFNSAVDIAAPGESVRVLSITSDSGYIVESGTSFAAPYVSGLAALIISELDDETTMNSDAFLALLRKSAGEKQHNDYFGYGAIVPVTAMELRNEPIVYGVFDGEVYFTPVNIYFNRGEGFLDGEKISSGQKVELNGEHNLVVEDDEKSVEVSFIVDTMPLKYSCPSGDTYYEPFSITFTRGTATLNGYPYYSGKTIEMSGQYKFVLTGPYGNTVVKNFTVYTDIPLLEGVTDGGVYTSPVTLRQIGEGIILLNGVEIPADVDTVVSENGNYTAVISNFGLTNSQTVRFTIDIPIRESSSLAITNPKFLYDNTGEIVICYGESVSGIRLYDSSDISEPFKFIALEKPVVDAILTEKYIVLTHENSITILKRTNLRNNSSPVYGRISFGGKLAGVVNASGLIYAAASDENSDWGIYYINLDAKRANKLLDIETEISDVEFSPATNRIYLWNRSGENEIFYYNIANASIVNHTFPIDMPAGDIACSDGYLFVSGNIFNETDLNSAVARGISTRLLLYQNGIIITENEVYNALTNEYYGTFKKSVSSIAFGSNNTVYVAFSDKSAEAYTNAYSPMSTSKVAQALRLVNPVVRLSGQESSTSDFSSHIAAFANFTLKDWVLAEDTDTICATGQGDLHLYVFNSEFTQIETLTLPMLPRDITTDGTKVFVTFDNSKIIYVLNTQTLNTTKVLLPSSVNTRHIEAVDGLVYLLSETKLLVLNSSTGTTKTLDLGQNAVSFTINEESSSLYVTVSKTEGSIDVYDLESLSKLETYPFIVSSLSLYCDGDYIYSENLVYDRTTMQLLYAMPGRIMVSNGDTVIIDNGIFDHSTKTVSVQSELFESSVPLLTQGNEVFVFEKGTGFIKIKNPFGIPLGKTPEITLEGTQNEAGEYEGFVRTSFDNGYGYLNGYPMSSGSTVYDGGMHVLTVVMPLGVYTSISFTVVPVLNSIEIVGGDTYLNVNESRYLSVTYSPKGVEKVPVVFETSNPDCVHVTKSGKITGASEGTAIITASTVDGEFSASIKVTVLSNDITFYGDAFSVNDRGVVVVDLVGTRVSALVDSVSKGNGSAAVYSGSKELGRSDLLITGARLSVLNIYGKEAAGAYITVRGDLDGNGIISSGDYLELKAIVSGENEGGAITFSAADINKDGKIDVKDMIILEEHLLANVQLSDSELKTLYVKEGEATVVPVSTVNVDSIARFRVVIDAGECNGVNGAVLFNSNIMSVAGVTAGNDGWEINYSIHNDMLYFNTYGSSVSVVSFYINTKISEFAKVGEPLVISLPFVNTNAVSVETKSLSVDIQHKLSDDSSLKSLILDGFEKQIEFDTSITEYGITVPFSVSNIKISAEANDSKAKIEITNTELLEDSTTRLVVKVTSEAGNVTEYYIDVFREADPSKLSSENRLRTLTPSTGVLSPSFDPEIKDYVLELPEGIYSVTFEYEALDNKSKVVYRLNSARTYVFTCTAEDGSKMVYNIKLLVDDDETDEDYYDRLFLYGSVLMALVLSTITLGIILPKVKKRSINRTQQ